MILYFVTDSVVIWYSPGIAGLLERANSEDTDLDEQTIWGCSGVSIPA